MLEKIIGYIVTIPAQVKPMRIGFNQPILLKLYLDMPFELIP
jgi:hypothetical protein